MGNSDDESDWLEWMQRVIAGDAGAEAELVSRYKKGIAIIIYRIVHDEAVADDLSQDTFKVTLEKIRDGQVREPERLSGFICGVARNLAIHYMRRARQRLNQEDVSQAEHLRDPQPDQFEQLWHKERAQIMRQLLGELASDRDRELLTRYFIAEESKEQICAEMGLTSLQFNSVLFRALKRYKELYIKRFGHL